MKKLLLLFCLIVSIQAKSQTVDSLPSKNGKIVYEAIVEQSKSKDQLYKAAKKWFVDSFNDSNSVIKSDNKESGELIGKGNFTLSEKGVLMSTNGYRYEFTVDVVCKDNKYRVQIYDITSTMLNPPAGASTTFTTKYPIDGYNDALKKTKNKRVHENAYLLDMKFKSIIDDLKIKIDKSTNDDF